MSNKPPEFEIPQELRDLAEKSVEQARDACTQVMGLARQAQQQAARSQGELAASALDIQAKALGYAEKNIAAGFDYAAQLAKARDFKEYLEIQTQFTQNQLESFTRQAQDLGAAWTEAAGKATKVER